MAPPFGINWQRYHADRQDMPHIEAMGYRAFTIYEWMWSNRDFVNELLSVARSDALFLARDHPLSEQKDQRWINDPAGKGRNHADEWAAKVQDGLIYTPIDRTFFLGLNEPDSNHYPRQIDAYNEAFCRRMAEHGLRVAAYSFGVGHPSTVDLREKADPDWSHYQASALAVREGSHIVATHEYGSPDGYGWGHWCNRIRYCPYEFDVIFDECGIDYGVVNSGELYGWAKYMSPDEYIEWLDGFQRGMAERAHTRKVNILAYNIFSFDHGSGENKDWHSFSIKPLIGKIEHFNWSEPTDPNAKPAAPEQPQPIPTNVPELVHPIADPSNRRISQRFGDNPQDYERFGLQGHAGVDYAVPAGTPVRAVDDGTVIQSSVMDDYGEVIKIAHLWGESVYAHLSVRREQEGNIVQAGDVIGYSGNTGNSSGDHLHFAMRVHPYSRDDGWDGFVDPMPYLEAQPTDDVKESAAREVYLDWFREYGRKYGVPWYLLASLAYNESGYDPTAVSHAGAQGLMQFMPKTWGDMQRELGVSDVLDPEQSIRASAFYLNQIRRYLFSKGKHKWREILAGYNAGPTRAAKEAFEQLPPETQQYARDVLVGSELLRRWEEDW